MFIFFTNSCFIYNKEERGEGDIRIQHGKTVRILDCAPLLVCKADQYIGPSVEFGDSPVPAGNCGPVSSGVHMLDRHVCILYEFMFYI
jgi:hypothetical protein